MIDLHTHSTASDGTDTPTLLIQAAGRKGLKAIALTDHDTVAGLGEADAAAKAAGIRFIPGIEIEIEFHIGEFHLLGLNLLDWKGSAAERLDELFRRRETRNLSIIGKMRDAGIHAEYEEVKDLANGSIVGRPHFAALLVKKGIVKSIEMAFKKFLAKGKPFYQQKECMTLEQGIDFIVSAGGMPVIAHPLSLFLSWSKLEAKIKEVHDMGVVGIEAYHPMAKLREAQRLECIARKLGMIVTAGSDYHGVNRPDRKLGSTCEGMKIDDTFLDAFPEKLP